MTNLAASKFVHDDEDFVLSSFSNCLSNVWINTKETENGNTAPELSKTGHGYIRLT